MKTACASEAPTTASTDRRAVRTRAALRDALAAEIDATGDLSRVTVTAVTDRADVTRRTFYSHFRDIPDLVDAIERETIEELEPVVARLAAVRLPELKAAIDAAEPCPGSVELLAFFKERGSYLAPLMGEGGDPGFVERIKVMVTQTIIDRAKSGLDARAIGPFLDYYLSFAISAETGVLVRWLTGGMHESVGAMARLMTALMFVRPGDLYGTPIDLDIPRFALSMLLS
jgi:AcrR family transcriptional regulator